jgi:hypothetical protein
MVKKYIKPKFGKRIVADYMNEVVSYGGEMVTRGAMIVDLQKIAKSYYPKDKQKQAALVSIYLAGHSRRWG